MTLQDTTRKEERTITVGSCNAYIKEWSGSLPDFADAAAVRTFVTAADRLGHSKGGATITYSKEVNELSDDFGILRRTILKSDSAKAKLGLFGWNGATLEKIESTARSSTVDTTSTIRTTKIGGVGNDDGKVWLLILHHPDAQAGDCWWFICGKNTAGMELSYSVDDGTKIEPEFSAESLDDDGTLIEYIEEVAKDTTSTGNAG